MLDAQAVVACALLDLQRQRLDQATDTAPMSEQWHMVCSISRELIAADIRSLSLSTVRCVLRCHVCVRHVPFAHNAYAWFHSL